MNFKESTTIKEEAIRHQFDDGKGEFYFSIIDVIDSLGLSKDSRNYWKVLKNRLKNSYNELVTECNQLKMKSSDGKYYLTDVGRASTILSIIQIISPEKVAMFEEFLNNIERKNFKNKLNNFTEKNTEEKISTVSDDDLEIKLDMYQKDNCIFVSLIAAGVEGENIFISSNCKILTIKFNRPEKNNISEKDYEAKELHFGKFSRTIALPYEIDIDRIETNFIHGLLIIKFFILDKTRTKIVKVK